MCRIPCRFFMVVCVVALLLLSFGCSSSDKSTNNNQSDPAALDQVEGLVGDDLYSSALQSLDLSLQLLDSVQAPQAPEHQKKSGFESLVAGDGDEVVIDAISSYVYQNGWHIFQFAGEVTSGVDTATLSGIDSVKVLVAGDPLGPGSDFDQGDEIVSYAHFSWTSSGEADITATADQRVGISLDVAGSDTTLLINGTIGEDLDASFADSTNSCDMSVDVSGSVSNLSLSTANPDCPNSGSITLSVALDFHCLSTGENPESLDLVANVTVNAVADGSSVTVTYTDGVNSRTVTESCEGVTASPWRFPEL